MRTCQQSSLVRFIVKYLEMEVMRRWDDGWSADVTLESSTGSETTWCGSWTQSREPGRRGTNLHVRFFFSFSANLSCLCGRGWPDRRQALEFHQPFSDVAHHPPTFNKFFDLPRQKQKSSYCASEVDVVTFRSIHPSIFYPYQGGGGGLLQARYTGIRATQKDRQPFTLT